MRVLSLCLRYLAAVLVALAVFETGRRLAGQPGAWSMVGLFAIIVVVVAVRRRVVVARPARQHLLALGAVAVGLLGAEAAFIWHLGHVDQRQPAAVIVVLGARVAPDGTPSEALTERVTTAVQLYRQGLAPALLVSGGTGREGVDEALVMKQMAVRMGVPDSAIDTDGDGDNTEATVEHARSWLAGHGGGRALVVSHAFHLARIRLLGARHGLACATVPADEGTTLLRGTPYYVLRESLGLAFYYLRG